MLIRLFRGSKIELIGGDRSLLYIAGTSAGTFEVCADNNRDSPYFRSVAEAGRDILLLSNGEKTVLLEGQ